MTERHCAHHESHPAIAICTGCGEDICATCHRPTVTGYAICSECEAKIHSVLKTRWESADGVLEHLYAFAWTSVAVLSSPRAFFGSVAPTRDWVKPAAFGIIAYTIGAYAAFLWNWAFVEEFQEVLQEYATQLGYSTDTAATVLLLALPFSAPLALGLHVLVLHLALGLLGARSSWRLVARFASYASAAYLFQVIPPVAGFPIGYILAVIWLVNVEMIAVQRYFDLSPWRAMAAVFLPFVLMIFLQI